MEEFSSNIEMVIDRLKENRVIYIHIYEMC